MFLVQGGYVSQSNSKTLTVSKKPNVLDKIPPRGPKSAAGSPNTTSSSPANNNNYVQDQSSAINVSDICLSFFFIFVKNSPI